MLRALLCSLFAGLLLSACHTVPTPRGFSAAQQAELHSQGFVEADNGWELSMADRLLFDSDSAIIRADMDAALDRIASGLLRVGIDAARVDGHTDSTGTAAHNARLSGVRAAAIAEALIERGFARNRVVEDGLGETRPVADNATESGRLLNRRVVIIVTPE